MELTNSLRVNIYNINVDPTYASLCTFIQSPENTIVQPQRLLNSSREFDVMKVFNCQEVFNVSEVAKVLNTESSNRVFPFQQITFLPDGPYHSLLSEAWSPIKLQLPPSPIFVQLPPSPISVQLSPTSYVKRFGKINETEDLVLREDTQTTGKHFIVSQFGEIDIDNCQLGEIDNDNCFEEDSILNQEKKNKCQNKRANKRRKQLSDNIRSLNNLLPYAICQNSRVSREVTLQKAHEYIVYLNEEIDFIKSQFNKTELKNRTKSIAQPIAQSVELTKSKQIEFAPYIKPSCSSAKTLDIFKKKKKHENMVKKPMNSFMLFSKENRSIFFKCFPGLSNREVSKLLGIAWQSVDEGHKDIYRKVSILQRL